MGNGCPELCGWGNNEQQYYSSSTDNVKVENGVLTITAKEDSLGGMSYSSGKIHSKHKGDFRYGRIEASMKLPESQGMWPAFWMLSTEKKYGEWPRSGEIDIMELLGHEPNKVYGTMHTGIPHIFKGNEYTLAAPKSFVDTFHVFSIDWDPDTIRWYVDGIQYHEMSSDSISPWAPFQENFYLILNIAVGGNWPGFTDSTTVFPQTMEVDYVRVYNTPDKLQIFGEQPVIGATDMIYRTFEIAGADYIWTVPSGSSIASGQGTSSISVDWGCTAGDILLELQTDCDTVFLQYDVDNFEEVKVDGKAIVEENQAGLSFSIPEVGGGSYNWTVPADANIITGQGSANITVDWGCSAGDVIVSAMSTCVSSITDTLPVSLQDYAITGFSIVPLNSTGMVYSIDSIPGAMYNWSVPTDAMIVSGQGSSSIIVDFGTTSGDVSVDVTTSCGTIRYALAVSFDPAFIYCDFDGIELTWGDFGGSTFEKIPNPFKTGINTSDHVGKTRKDPGSQNWAGIFADLAGEMDFVTNPFIHMKVYTESTGDVKFKIEDNMPGMASPVEVDLAYTTPNQWVNMVWDFSSQPADVFDRVALFFDFGSTDTSNWYFDDIIGRSSSSTRLEDLEWQSIKLFPNPTQEQLFIDLNGLFKSESDFVLQLIDTQGKVIYHEKKQTSREAFSINVSHLPAGTYFIRLLSQYVHYVKPFEKIHD
jgi:beta-glucanase (GH16 family)